jgi:hypothetical protein
VRIITELVGGVALLAIFAYGVYYIIDIFNHMEIKNGTPRQPPSMGAAPDQSTRDDGASGEKPN